MVTIPYSVSTWELRLLPEGQLETQQGGCRVRQDGGRQQRQIGRQGRNNLYQLTNKKQYTWNPCCKNNM